MPDADSPLVGAAPGSRAAPRHVLTRREGLLALALLAPAGLLAACTGSSEPSPSTSTATAAPVDLAAEVAAEESELIAMYDDVLATAADLDADTTALLNLIRDQHAQHLESLGGTPSSAPQAGAPSPATASTAVASLITAEREAARSRIRACVASDDADLARLLTFIGASEASHVPALRDLDQVRA